eukprot:TRINITY_DN2358_c0_g1_i3.p1 TRINITY_DN2358_c0_g1~~TRINITY_DN2358_c0_g1_i3.p1  ORF type:complete len:308 (+),score=82.66 TRINITY_DN2358_c0_g1_i3:49-924(+)
MCIRDRYSTLAPTLVNKHPLLAVSAVIQGEKGFHLLNKLLRVTNPEFFNRFMVDWFYSFDRNRVTRNDLLDLFQKDVNEYFDYFTHFKIEIAANLSHATTVPGLVPSEIKFTLPVIQELEQIANDYIKANGTTSPDNWINVEYYNAKAQLAFLQIFHNRSEEVSADVIKRLIQDFEETFIKGETEVRASWVNLLALRLLALKSTKVKREISEFLKSNGIFEYLRPIYRALKQNGQSAFALNALKANKNFYHPFVTFAIKQELTNQREREHKMRIYHMKYLARKSLLDLLNL